MASAEIALVCGLKVWVGCQDRLCVNSDADETLAQWFPTFDGLWPPSRVSQHQQWPPVRLENWLSEYQTH